MKNKLSFLVATLCLCHASLALADTLSKEPTVSIAFVGDIMLDDTPGKYVKKGHDPFAPFASQLASADVRVGNLECVIATVGSAEVDKPYTFRAHPRNLKLLKKHFDAVSLANNHTGDFGPEAFNEMLTLLDKNKIGYFGGGANLSKAHTPLIIERNGLKIALLGYDEFFPRSFEADFDKSGVAWSEDEQVQFDIIRARKEFHADLVIPMMHWGWEHEGLASPRQRQLARLMIDAGADAVIGGHPHVTQDIEHYQGKPIIYSLGNFVFDGFSSKENNTGWLLRMEFDRQGARNWRIETAHIDKIGFPHPAKEVANQCWRRGDAESAACNSSEAQRKTHN
jgi:poly-gamma-glutamate capsule biosynthesis protein CapA/YwtB (metallophosphatase superfamily)